MNRQYTANIASNWNLTIGVAQSFSRESLNHIIIPFLALRYQKATGILQHQHILLGIKLRHKETQNGVEQCNCTIIRALIIYTLFVRMCGILRRLPMTLFQISLDVLDLNLLQTVDIKIYREWQFIWRQYILRLKAPTSNLVIECQTILVCL